VTERDFAWGFASQGASSVTNLALSLVAARLRQVIQVHAEKVGCDCGSREWLAAEQLRNVEHGTQEEE
jgi:hypothetical protein